MPLKVDLSRFKQLVRDIAVARKKEVPQILNKGLLTAIIGSSKYKGIIQLTPKATKARIKADLRKNKLNIKLSVITMKQEGWFKARHSRAETQQRISDICKARLLKRDISRAYIAAGWIRSARDIGFGIANIRSRATKLWSGGTAAQGYGITAKAGRLKASAFNMSRGADVVCGPFMQQAVQGACADMADYFHTKLGKVFARLSRL